MDAKRRIWKMVMMISSFVLGIALVLILVAAMQSKSDKPCTDVQLHFTNTAEQRFTGYEVVMILMDSKGIKAMKGKPVKNFDLKAMELRLEEHPWINNAELYFDNKRVLHAKIEEKLPIARVFTPKGGSFYIDSSMHRLPLNDRLSPRLPVFTGFPTDKPGWKGKDSLLMADLKAIAQYIHADSFWMAQVDQVDINEKRQFELWPKVGEHYILFGDGTVCAEKFRKLDIFYQQVLAKGGLNLYSMLDLRFDGQVVATRSTRKFSKADTAAYRQWYKQLKVDEQEKKTSK